MTGGGGGVGEAAGQLVKEMQKAQQEAQNLEQKNPEPNSQFSQQMDTQQAQQVQPPTNVHEVTEVSKSSNVLLKTREAKELPSTKVGATEKLENSRVVKMLEAMTQDQKKVDDLMKRALSGAQFNQQELIAMQATVYKFTSELDLVSKVVEKATSGIKQTLSTQV